MRGNELWTAGNRPAKFDHLLDHFIGGFHDDQFLTRGQCDHGIRRRLHVLDEVGVQHHWNPIDAR